MATNDRSLDWRHVHVAIALVVAALFLYALLPVLSPVLLYAALVLMLSPYAGTRGHALTVGTGAGLLAFWLLRTLGTLLAPFVLAFVLAFILDPLVDRLERWRLPRPVAVASLALPGLALLAVLVFWGVPALADQVGVLIRQAPTALARVAEWIERLRTGQLHLPFVPEQVISDQLRSISPERVIQYLQEQQQAIVQHAWQAVSGMGRGFASVLTVLGYVVLTPVLTFYLLRDYDLLIARVGSLVPKPSRESVGGFFAEYETLLARYLRGQLMEAALVGILTWLGLWILGFPYAGLVGVVAGVFNMVPYLGLAVSLIPAIIIALFSGNVLGSLLKVVVVFVVVQALDGSVTGPKIVGGAIGLHPVWVILALALGGAFFGFVGLLIAMPAAIFLKLLLNRGLEHYRASGLYLGDAA
ncbi:MAG: AI-2E family transporter [Gemmatimonadota bacterium]